MSFKLTYSTMFDPPEEMHERFEAAVQRRRASPAATHALYIGGRDVPGASLIDNLSPIDGTLLGRFGAAGEAQVAQAVEAARLAFPAWRATSLATRVALFDRIAALIEERVYDIAAAVSLEVGKNRFEALGEVQEVADFFRCYAAHMVQNRGFDRPLPDDPVRDVVSRNRSVLKPYGVWAVIAPFNFPMALAAGPAAAALITGNTVVAKGASDTPWATRLLADCLRDAGVPAGVFNLIAGSGDLVGEALVVHPAVAGVTFTGSHAVGRALAARLGASPVIRPCIAEMGGKNAVIVTAGADLERAATGILRSAFGLSGQKCSAASRVYVDRAVLDPLLERLVKGARELLIGDPTARGVQMGPVISARAVGQYQSFITRLRDGGRLLAGGERLTRGAFADGCFVAPTVALADCTHPLYREEMFLPILMVAGVSGLAEGLRLANDSVFGLTAGFYGAKDEVPVFLDGIEAGTVYVNRPQGATTGAWPGYQAFGGWKASTSTGKAIGSDYYLPQYLREQSQTVVE